MRRDREPVPLAPSDLSELTRRASSSTTSPLPKGASAALLHVRLVVQPHAHRRAWSASRLAIREGSSDPSCDTRAIDPGALARAAPRYPPPSRLRSRSSSGPEGRPVPRCPHQTEPTRRAQAQPKQDHMPDLARPLGSPSPPGSKTAAFCFGDASQQNLVKCRSWKIHSSGRSHVGGHSNSLMLHRSGPLCSLWCGSCAH
jgi:hypothetical protein